MSKQMLVIAAAGAAGLAALFLLGESPSAATSRPTAEPVAAEAPAAPTRSVASSHSAPARVPAATDADPVPASPSALEMENMMLRGTIQNLSGVPQTWPTDLPSVYRPGAYAANTAILAERLPGGKVASVDCDEYPCIGYVQVAGAFSDRGEKVFPEVEDLWGPDGSVSVSQSTFGDGPDAYTIIAIAASADSSEELRERVGFRAQSGMADLAPEGRH